MVRRAPRGSITALAAAGALASTGTAYVGARNLLISQAAKARSLIPKSWDVPPRADGVYTPGGGPVQRWQRGMDVDLHLMIFGDSTATGYGCRIADEVPGVLIARGLAEQSGKRVRLSTKAIVGATSKGLSGQVDAMFVAGPPPDAAVILIGANDVTKLNGIGASSRRLGAAVRRLKASGAEVVVATCPDFGVVKAIPQPLRWTVRTLGLRLARAQSGAVRSAGGVPVPLASLVNDEFRHSPHLMLSDDQFHPVGRRIRTGREPVAAGVVPGARPLVRRAGPVVGKRHRSRPRLFDAAAVSRDCGGDPLPGCRRRSSYLPPAKRLASSQG